MSPERAITAITREVCFMAFSSSVSFTFYFRSLFSCVHKQQNTPVCRSAGTQAGIFIGKRTEITTDCLSVSFQCFFQCFFRVTNCFNSSEALLLYRYSLL